MKRFTYAVFFPKSADAPAPWARTNNKRHAIQSAKQHGGYVTAMDYHSGNGSWDDRTFRVCSDLIADFTEDKSPTKFYTA